MGLKDLKSSLYLSSSSTTADIKEVSRATSLQTDNIHSGHGESSSIYHAANVSVKGNVVEPSFSGLCLIDISGVLSASLFMEVDNIFLTVLSGRVNSDLSINAV